MFTTELACCHFPTTVTLIDDSTSFLTNLALHLHKHNIVSRTFSNPEDALHYLRDDYQIDPAIDNCIEHYSNLELDDYDQHSVVKVDTLYQQIFNPNRYNEIAVLIVDQSMPLLNGMDLCRALRDFPFKILMLTGATSSSEVISAFNEGIIDKFVSKNELENFDNLIAMIQELQKKYFYERSRIIMQNIMLGQTVIKEKAFIQLFNHIVQKYNIVEYFMYQHEGSYVLLDQDGNAYWLIVQSKEHLEHWHEVAMYHERSDEILEQLKNHRTLFFVDSNSPWPNTDEEWLEHCYPIEPIPSTDYYYTLITPEMQKPIHGLLKTKKGYSYQEFIAKNCGQ